jgi:hypothetical protein
MKKLLVWRFVLMQAACQLRGHFAKKSKYKLLPMISKSYKILPKFWAFGYSRAAAR